MMSSPVGEESLVKACAVCGAEVDLDTLPLPPSAACKRCGHLLWFRRRVVDGIVVLDVLSAKSIGNGQMERATQSLLDCGSVPRVVLNLSEVKFASSSFIAGLVSLHKRIRAAEGKLVLCGLRPVIQEVLHGARLDKLFVIADDEENALAEFADGTE
jgi:anti-sigma B factor antagonist